MLFVKRLHSTPALGRLRYATYFGFIKLVPHRFMSIIGIEN
jgi:hypothetical protein